MFADSGEHCLVLLCQVEEEDILSEPRPSIIHGRKDGSGVVAASLKHKAEA